VKITDRFIGDHKSFRKMLFELGQMAGEPIGQIQAPRLVRLVELLKDQFQAHARAEDEAFYSKVRTLIPQAPEPLCVRLLGELEAEHQALVGAIDHLERQVRRSPPQPGWPDTYAHFFQKLQNHMKKEEEQLFPLSERIFGPSGLEKLSQALKENRPHTHA